MRAATRILLAEDDERIREQLEEAFLTTSVRGLVPIVRLGGVTLGTGRPGPWTLRLSEAYADEVERGSARAWPREP